MQLQFNSDIIELLMGTPMPTWIQGQAITMLDGMLNYLSKKKKEGWNVEPDRAVTTAQALAKPLV